MDQQPKYKAQAAGAFYADGRAMRAQVEGTVARGQLPEDTVFSRGMYSSTGKLVEKSPVEITAEGLARGRERFNIYCAVCHGQTGNGHGIMVERGFVPPPSFHTDLIRNYPDGHIFDVITNGIRNMPAYRAQIPVKDRWLIIDYLRALQRSQNAKIADVPEPLREQLMSRGQ